MCTLKLFVSRERERAFCAFRDAFLVIIIRDRPSAKSETDRIINFEDKTLALYVFFYNNISRFTVYITIFIKINIADIDFLNNKIYRYLF